MSYPVSNDERVLTMWTELRNINPAALDASSSKREWAMGGRLLLRDFVRGIASPGAFCVVGPRLWVPSGRESDSRQWQRIFSF